MFKERLNSCLSRFDMAAADGQAERLERFAVLLLEKNRVMNLTAVKTLDDCAERHMADSLFLFKCADLRGKKILDIGTGGGFPGMPLKLWEPSLDITMLDSTAKRIAFINEAAEKLGISVNTITGRAEEVCASMAGRFDIVTSRAVAPLNILAEISMGFLKHGGLFLPMKSVNPDADEELKQAEHAISFMGGQLEGQKLYSTSDSSPRRVLMIRKSRPTPRGYPRKYAAISKKPL